MLTVRHIRHWYEPKLLMDGLLVRHHAPALQDSFQCLLRDLAGAVSGDTEAIL